MPELPDELMEEVFLRLPPDEPAALVRASLASKPWHGVLTGPAFRGRYREFHGTPPMLGFLYALSEDTGHEEDPVPLFASTTKFDVCIPDLTTATHRRLDALDCRHGRVLLVDSCYFRDQLVIWNPVTGCTRELERPDIANNDFEIAVLCAVIGCDHRSCHAGPFKLVCVDVDKREEGECFARAFVSSPDMGDWSKPSELHRKEWKEHWPGLDLAPHAFIYAMPAVLVDDALHFLLGYNEDADGRLEILKYSLSSDSLSLVDPPLAESIVFWAPILMAMKDGTLGFAHVDNRLTLCVWSRQIQSDGVESWTPVRLVDLNSLLPIKNPKRRLRLIGSVEGSDIIFVNMDLGVYEIDLQTLEWKERMKRENLHSLIPYMSFYNPPEFSRQQGKMVTRRRQHASYD